MPNNDKCNHSLTFYTIKTKLCKFNVYSIFSLCVMCLIDFYARTLSRDVYTDWVVVFVLNEFLNYKEKNIKLTLTNISKNYNHRLY